MIFDISCFTWVSAKQTPHQPTPLKKENFCIVPIHMSRLKAPLILTDVESGAAPSGSSSKITDTWLLKYNKVAGFLHFAQASLMLATYFSVDSVSSFTRPISYSYVVYDEDTSNLAQQVRRGRACGGLTEVRELLTLSADQLRFQPRHRPRHAFLPVPFRPSARHRVLLPWSLH